MVTFQLFIQSGQAKDLSAPLYALGLLYYCKLLIQLAIQVCFIFHVKQRSYWVLVG